MSRKSLLAGLTAGSLALCFAFATPSEARRSGSHGPRLERAIERLDLDADTRAQAYAVIDAARPASRELRASLRAAYEEMRTLMEQPQPSEEAVLAAVEEIGGLKPELRMHDVRTLLQVGALLTPEQAEKLRSKLHRGHKGRHGHGDRKR